MRYCRLTEAIAQYDKNTYFLVHDRFPSMGSDHPLSTCSEEHIANRHQGWLLIFDNVEDLVQLKPFLPASGQGALLFTTRLHTLGTLAQTIEIAPMAMEESKGDAQTALAFDALRWDKACTNSPIASDEDVFR